MAHWTPHFPPVSSPLAAKKRISLFRGTFSLFRIEKDHHLGDPHGLVVKGAASIDISIFDDSFERIDFPLILLSRDNVDVIEEENRLLRSVSFQCGQEIAPPGRGLEDLAGNGLCLKDLLKEAGSLDLITRRVDGVDARYMSEKVCAASFQEM